MSRKVFLENCFRYMRSALLMTFFRDEELFVQILNAHNLDDLNIYLCINRRG